MVVLKSDPAAVAAAAAVVAVVADAAEVAMAVADNNQQRAAKNGDGGDSCGQEAPGKRREAVTGAATAAGAWCRTRS